MPFRCPLANRSAPICTAAASSVGTTADCLFQIAPQCGKTDLRMDMVEGRAANLGALWCFSSPRTPRHLRLTDLARSDWTCMRSRRSLAIAAYKLLIYIHLSRRGLSQRIARGMAEIHAWRSKMLEDLLK